MTKRQEGKLNSSKPIRFPDERENTLTKQKNDRKRVRFYKVPIEKSLASKEINHRNSLNKPTCECLKIQKGETLFNYRSKNISGCIKKRSGGESVCAANFCCPALYLTSDNINSIASKKVSRLKGKSVTGRYNKNETTKDYYTHESGTFVLCRNTNEQWQVSSVFTDC